MQCQPSDLVATKFLSVHGVTQWWLSSRYFEVVSMDQASSSIECQSFISVDNVFHVLQHHRVFLQNPSYGSWADFVNYDEIGIVAYSSKLWFGLVYM